MDIVYFIMDLLLHVAFIGAAIPVMFFTYGAFLQKDLMKTEVYKIVHDLLRPIMGAVSYVFEDVKWNVEASAAEHAQERNNTLIREKVRNILIIMSSVCIILFLLILFATGRPFPWMLIGSNIVMTAAVVLAEMVFLYVIVRKFRPIDVDDIQKRLVERLDEGASASS